MLGIGVAFMLIMLFMGMNQGSFPLLYLGFFCMLMLGLFIMSDGIQIDNGVVESPVGSHNFITAYEVHTTANDPIVNILANTMFYLPFGCILLTTLFAIYRR
jgi:hypothetical protein